MRLRVRQLFTQISAPQVAAAYADPALYERFAGLPFGGDPEVVEHQVESDGSASLAIRYRIEADLPSAARMFVDPDKLTFIEYARVDANGTGSFDIVPDHYSRMLQAFGEIKLTDGPTSRSLVGELNIDLGWAGMMFRDQAESQIGQGLARVIEAQVKPVEAFVLGQ